MGFFHWRLRKWPMATPLIKNDSPSLGSHCHLGGGVWRASSPFLKVPCCLNRASSCSCKHSCLEFMSSVAPFGWQDFTALFPILCDLNSLCLSFWRFPKSYVEVKVDDSAAAKQPWLLTFGILTGYESLYKLLPTAKRSFSDQDCETHKCVFVTIYLEGSMTTCPFHKITMPLATDPAGLRLLTRFIIKVMSFVL